MADNNKNKAQRGDSLYQIAAILKKVWTVLFAVVKIAAGAAATLILIGVVCMFVLMGVLGDYLEPGSGKLQSGRTFLCVLCEQRRQDRTFAEGSLQH